jgi:hypothetical protein
VNFRGALLQNPALKMCRIKESWPIWGIGDPLFEAGRMTKPHLPLAGGR